MRSVENWVGRTHDTAIPPRVRLRVFESCEGRCHRCRRKLTPADKWSIEHLIALANGGAHSEANMAISCEWCKPLKDAEDVAIKAKGSRVRMRHAGIKRASSRPLPGTKASGFRKKFNGEVVLRAPSRGRE